MTTTTTMTMTMLGMLLRHPRRCPCSSIIRGNAATRLLVWVPGQRRLALQPPGQGQPHGPVPCATFQALDPRLRPRWVVVAADLRPSWALSMPFTLHPRSRRLLSTSVVVHQRPAVVRPRPAVVRPKSAARRVAPPAATPSPAPTRTRTPWAPHAWKRSLRRPAQAPVLAVPRRLAGPRCRCVAGIIARRPVSVRPVRPSVHSQRILSWDWRI